MTFKNLLSIMNTWGMGVKESELENFRHYLFEMMKRNRVIIIRNDGGIEAVIMFHLTNNYDKLYRKSVWTIPEDEPDGSQIYIDKMVCKRWTPTLRRQVRDTIEDYFPGVQSGYFHRAPYDRCVKIYRRGRNLCTQ